jgi:hypothetical protein
MARIILEELGKVVKITGRSIPFVDLAYLVVCFELQDAIDRQEELRKLQRIIDFSPYCQTQQKKYLVAF